MTDHCSLASCKGTGGDAGRGRLPYNVPVTDERQQTPTPAGPDAEDTSSRASPPVAEAKQPNVPVFVAGTSDRKWQGGAGLSRWTSWGCVLGIIILVAMLIFGVAITKRTAWMAFERGRQRVIGAAERLNDPPRRLRTARNLDRYEVQLRVSSDPYPEMGEFLKMVRLAFEDGELTVAELEEINAYLESKLPVGAVRGMKE